MGTSEAIHPSEYVRDEMAARGWTPREFELASGLPSGLVERILADRKFTASMAEGCARAFGTSTELWLGLARRYRNEQWGVAQ